MLGAMNLKHLLIIILVYIFTILKICRSSNTQGDIVPLGIVTIYPSPLIGERVYILFRKYVLYKEIFRLSYYNTSTHYNNNTKQTNKNNNNTINNNNNTINNNNKPKFNNKLLLKGSSNNIGLQSASKDKWKFIKGYKGLSKFSHSKAKNFIKKGELPNLDIINDILSYCNIKVTGKELKNLLNLQKYNINTKDNKKMMGDINNLLGFSKYKNQIPGIYIFTHVKTGRKYVGSSTQLSIRLCNYIKKKDKPEGLIRPLLYEEGISEFLLEVIPIYKKWDFRAELVLEQYYLLNPSFNLNVIKVANNPGGSNSKSLYMYNRDKTILYYYSYQQNNFIKYLKIHFETLKKHLNNNTYYLGKYFFSRTLIETAIISNITLTDLGLKLEKDRIKFNKNKSIKYESWTILLTPLNKPKETLLFNGYRPCIKFLRNEKDIKTTRETLIKYIKNGLPFYGYICKLI
jgi:hypothetical protein